MEGGRVGGRWGRLGVEIWVEIVANVSNDRYRAKWGQGSRFRGRPLPDIANLRSYSSPPPDD